MQRSHCQDPAPNLIREAIQRKGLDLSFQPLREGSFGGVRRPEAERG